MKMRLLLILSFVALTIGVNAQISRGDLNKATTRGTELMQRGSLEDAVAVFNEILSKDPTEGQALLLRARAKYELSAYKGAKKDCFAYMDIYGIDHEVAGILGKTEKALENYKQALAYLKTALFFEPDGIEYLMDRAEIYYNLGLDEQACIDWHQAMINGSKEAQALSRKNCKRVRVPIEEVRPDNEPIYDEEDDSDPEELERETNDNATEDDKSANEDESIDNTEENTSEDPVDNEAQSEESETETEESETESEEEDQEIEDAYPIDTRIEEMYVDEDLSLLVGGGIGSRKVTEKPDILILSDRSGEVVVDICVDRLGRVTDTRLNEDASTLKTASLVSLALRESSNFRFARSSRKNHCGTITFVFTASN